MSSKDISENVPNNQLEGAFTRYVSDAYENGEFSMPEPELVGDAADHIDSEGEIGYTVIRQQLGDTALTHMLTGDGHGISILNDNELIMQHASGNILVMDRDLPTKIKPINGEFETIDEHATISANALFDVPEVKSAEQTLRDMLDDNKNDEKS